MSAVNPKAIFAAVLVVTLFLAVWTVAENEPDDLVEDLDPDSADAKSSNQILVGLPGNYVTLKTLSGALSFHYDTVVSFSDAQSFCRFDFFSAGFLVTVNTTTKQHQVETLIKKVRNRGDFTDAAWINAKYDEDCGVFRNGYSKIFYQASPQHTFGYNHWATAQPNLSHGNCVVISYFDRFRWLSRECESNAAIICEWDKCSRWYGNSAGCNRQPGCSYDFMFDDCHHRDEGGAEENSNARANRTNTKP